MLAPTDRRLLLDALAPPDGFELDHAIGTTYTLDLHALLRVPLAATILPWSGADGEPLANPYALLDALRRHARKISLFCQAGAIKVPPRHQPLLTFLEPCINQVVAPRGGVFHPKVWVLRFGAEDEVRYRLLVLSRNLTFDRSWDVALALDGELIGRKDAYSENHPLGDLLATLPTMADAAGQPVAERTAGRVDLLQREIRRVKWEFPVGFWGPARFHALGLGRRDDWPFEDLYRMLVISPFVTDSGLKRLRRSVRKDVRLIARFEELQKLGREALDPFIEVETFDDAQGLLDLGGTTEDPTADQDQEPTEPGADQPELGGLHAKVYLAEAHRRAVLFVGSANATDAAFERNVEFLVELEGSRTAAGIDALLDGLRGAGLVRKFEPAEPVEEDPIEEGLRSALERLAIEIASGGMRVVVVDGPEGRHRLELRLVRPLPAEGVSIEARPITIALAHAVEVDREPVAAFPPVTATQVTPFIAFTLEAQSEGRVVRQAFVACLPLIGAPEGRAEAVTAELLSDKERLLRFLWLLLSDTTNDVDAALDALSRGTDEGPGPAGNGGGTSGLPLLEPMLRALHRDPNRLDEVGQVIADLRTAGVKAEILPPELEELWATMAEVRKGR